MTRIVYVQPDGVEDLVDASEGVSVMFAAIQNGVRGIAAECGGVLSCATCHVYVDPAWAERLPPPDDDEQAMLELTAAERRATSRLSCQLIVATALDGLRVMLPEAQ
jgi:2Fe-2S ferredoxin